MNEPTQQQQYGNYYVGVIAFDLQQQQQSTEAPFRVLVDCNTGMVCRVFGTPAEPTRIETWGADNTQQSITGTNQINEFLNRIQNRLGYLPQAMGAGGRRS